MPTAFTIGSRSSYDRALATEPEVKKLGRQPDYGGGWVWRTREAAEAFIEAHPNLGFEPKVYGLVLPANWDKDVSPEPAEDGVHRLLHDALIVQL